MISLLRQIRFLLFATGRREKIIHPGNPVIYYSQTAKKGRGVFALKPFKKHELIERAPVIVIPQLQADLLRETVLSDYFFDWDDNYAIALGYGSLFNHSYDPNAGYIYIKRDQVIDFFALEDIDTDVEITVNYNGYPSDTRTTWFDAVE